MSSFALIFNGKVADVAPAEFPVHPDLTWVDISAVSPAPQHGWSYSGGVFAAPAAPVLTLAQQAGMALASGLAVTSTGTPALNGVYSVDTTAQMHVNAEVTAILLNGTFADGTATVAWHDTSGAAHTYTVAQFKVLASAVGSYVAALFKVINGTLTTLPPSSVTIP